MNLYNKGIKYADKLYNEAKKERDTKGYRENLGYDNINKLKDKISELQEENYQAYCSILDHYNKLCDSL